LLNSNISRPMKTDSDLQKRKIEVMINAVKSRGLADL
jgi:hypothetical protein